MAGNVAGERQLIGIIKSDDRFQAAKSAKRPSSHDPKLSAMVLECAAES